jgi:hypothetical protein
MRICTAPAGQMIGNKAITDKGRGIIPSSRPLDYTRSEEGMGPAPREYPATGPAQNPTLCQDQSPNDISA